MKFIVTGMAILSLLLAMRGPARAAEELTLNYTVAKGTPWFVDHHLGVTLADGFWAQAESDLTITINQTPGYYLDKSPLEAKDQQYTATGSRTFIVAGCVPHKLVVKFVGSHWVACNDLDGTKDKVAESKFISCVELHRNGVVSGVSVKEINNRTWESFRFSCQDLSPGGSLTESATKSDFLFNLKREGKLHEASIPDYSLSYGIKEYWQSSFVPVGEALSSFAILRGSASHLEKGKQQDDRDPPSEHYFGQSEVIPDYPTALPLTKLRWYEWKCPPTMVLTGAAMGHIPDKKGKDTRPVYLLGECRKLLHNP